MYKHQQITRHTCLNCSSNVYPLPASRVDSDVPLLLVAVGVIWLDEVWLAIEPIGGERLAPAAPAPPPPAAAAAPKAPLANKDIAFSWPPKPPSAARFAK